MEYNESISRSRGVQLNINGVDRQAATATVTIRPGRGVTISVDVPPDITLTDEQMGGIADLFGPFIEECIVEAVDAGIPVPLLSPTPPQE